MANLSTIFLQNWNRQFSGYPVANVKLLVAVSGGVDSVVLTDLLYNAGFDFVIAHANFNLRGKESNRDEAFVHSLAGKYKKAVWVNSFETKDYAAQNKLSIQEAARELRYTWFKELLEGMKKDSQKKCFIVTAHHANDNIETLLINFFRGTGISGLHGILPVQQQIIRPLLFAKRESILAYAKEQSLGWVEDSSNASDKYTRNFFRLQLLPSIKEIFPEVEDNLLQNIERFTEAEQLYNQAIQIHKKKLAKPAGDEIHIPILALQEAAPLHAILWEIIKPFHFNAAQVNAVKKLMDASNGSYVASPTHRVIKNRKWLVIATVQTLEAKHIVIETTEKRLLFQNGSLSFETLAAEGFRLNESAAVANLDAAIINFPLLLRKWKQGDYFYPLGMQKKKKLSRFFIDQKLSKTEKEKVWVLEMDKKIVWVIGYRIDNRFKIADASESILQIIWSR